MSYLIVDGDQTEWISSHEPIRLENTKEWIQGTDFYYEPIGAMIELPKGSIKKLIGRELTWEDEPVEI